MHETSWTLVDTYLEKRFPVVASKSTMEMAKTMSNKLQTWMTFVQEDIGGGVRRADLEYYVYWVNLTTIGIASGFLQDWVLGRLTADLNDKKENSCCILIAPNRAQDIKK